MRSFTVLLFVLSVLAAYVALSHPVNEIEVRANSPDNPLGFPMVGPFSRGSIQNCGWWCDNDINNG